MFVTSHFWNFKLEKSSVSGFGSFYKFSKSFQ